MAGPVFFYERRSSASAGGCSSGSAVGSGSSGAIAAIAAALNRMELDWPPTKPKRRRATAGGSWWEAPQSPDPEASCEDLGLLGLVDALMLFAGGTNLGAVSGAAVYNSCMSSSNFNVGYCPDKLLSTSPQLMAPCQQSAWHPAMQAQAFSCVPEFGAASSSVTPSISNATAMPATTAVLEPLVRALTQLANAAASGSGVRRQLISDCQVHIPLLRLMQDPRAQLPLVVERCCRLLHWLCVGTPENRDVLGGYRGPSTGCSQGSRVGCGYRGGSAESLGLSFVDAVLGAVEAHTRHREVIANAFRALVALLPCPRVQEDLLRTPTRFLACLTLGGEILDGAAVRSVCRWLPGISKSVRRTRKLAGLDSFDECSPLELQSQCDPPGILHVIESPASFQVSPPGAQGDQSLVGSLIRSSSGLQSSNTALLSEFPWGSAGVPGDLFGQDDDDVQMADA